MMTEALLGVWWYSEHSSERPQSTCCLFVTQEEDLALNSKHNLASAAAAVQLAAQCQEARRHTFSTQGGKGTSAESPTLPPQAWKLMTACSLRPAALTASKTWEYPLQSYCCGRLSTAPHCTTCKQYVKAAAETCALDCSAIGQCSSCKVVAVLARPYTKAQDRRII